MVGPYIMEAKVLPNIQSGLDYDWAKIITCKFFLPKFGWANLRSEKNSTYVAELQLDQNSTQH